MTWLHGVGDDTDELARQRLEIDLLAQARCEVLERPPRVVLAPRSKLDQVEAASGIEPLCGALQAPA